MGNANTQTPEYPVSPKPSQQTRMARSMSYHDVSQNSQSIVESHSTISKNANKILLFGCNRAKSDFFNGTTRHQQLVGIAYQPMSLDINDKLRKVKTLVYDTATDRKYVKDTLKYIPSVAPHGMILTYSTHDIESLNYLKKYIKGIKKAVKKTRQKSIPFLLLAMHEKGPKHKHTNCIDIGQEFAHTQELFHLQIDMKFDLKTKHPYIYLMKKILKLNEDEDSLVNFVHDIILSEQETISPESKAHVHNDHEVGLSDSMPPLPANTFQKNLSSRIILEENIMDDILEHIMIVDHGAEGIHRSHSVDPPRTKPTHHITNSANLPDRVHSRIPPSPGKQLHRMARVNSKIPASFKAYQRKKAESDRIMNGTVDTEQLLWNKYVAAHGMTQTVEQFMDFCTSRGYPMNHEDALHLMEENNALHNNGTDAYETSENQMNEDHEAKDFFGGDQACNMEFERFFETVLGTVRSHKYLNKFKEKCYNDIRLIDPEIFDDEWFTSGDIKMEFLDKKLFKKEVIKYKEDCNKFEELLNVLKMKEKYHKQFVNYGIATLWSFYHHIDGVEKVQWIVHDEQHALLIWDALRIDNEEKESPGRGLRAPSRQYPMSDEGQYSDRYSDSEEMYSDQNADKHSDDYGSVHTPGDTQTARGTINTQYRKEKYENEKEYYDMSQSMKFVYVEEAKYEMKEETERDVKQKKKKRKKRRSKPVLTAYEQGLKQNNEREKRPKTPRKMKKRSSRKEKKNKEVLKEERVEEAQVEKDEDEDHVVDNEDRMPLNEVAEAFELDMGHKPQSVQQMLSFCQQHDIEWKFKDINRWWRNRKK